MSNGPSGTARTRPAKASKTIPYPFGYKGGYGMPGGNKGATSVANGLYHYGQRYYDPRSGRWAQQDQQSRIAIAVQGDRFLFAGADPINRSDPTGLHSFEEGAENALEACAIGAAGGTVIGSTVAAATAGASVAAGAVAGAAEGCAGGAVASLGKEFVEEVF